MIISFIGGVKIVEWEYGKETGEGANGCDGADGVGFPIANSESPGGDNSTVA